MKRRTLFTTVVLTGALALAGCSSNEPDDTKTPSEGSSPSATASTAESDAPTVDKELRAQTDAIVSKGVSAKPGAIKNSSDVMAKADKYLDEHEGAEADGTDNPFATLKNFSAETNEGLYKIYSKDSPMLEFFDLEGLEPNEKAAIALWSQSMPIIFTQGEVTVGSDVFTEDGDKAAVDLSKAKVTTPAGQSTLIEANEELGRLPMVKKDGKWLIDSKAYYSKLEDLTS